MTHIRVRHSIIKLCRTSVCFKECGRSCVPNKMQLKCTNLPRVINNILFQRNKPLLKKWLPGLSINHQNQPVNGHQQVVDQVDMVRLALVMVRVDLIHRDMHRNRILTGLLDGINLILKFLSTFSYFDDDLLGQQQQRLVAPSAGRRATKQSALANLNRYVHLKADENLALGSPR